MLLLDKITNDPYQTQTVVLPDGNSFILTLYFAPMQYAWNITELTWNDFTIKGFRITNQPNMLQQWKNLIPFGLACFSNEDREPTLQNDFSSGQSKLYVLTSEEVEEYTEYLKSV